MGSHLAINIREEDNVVFVQLSGIINEDNDLAESINQINKSTVVINTADVDRINSCGVRDWVTWLNELEKKGIAPLLNECSPAIMTQVNLVNNFVGSGTIISFYAPYYCPSCDTDKMLLIEVKEAIKNLPFRPPICRCDQCDHTMEFDDIESSYFAFLSSVKTKDIEASLAEKIKQLSNDTDSKLRTRVSTVAGTNRSSSPSVFSSGAPSTFFGPTPTTPSAKHLKGLLSESITYNTLKTSTTDYFSPTNKILLLVLGLLVIAIAMLGYVVLRTA